MSYRIVIYQARRWARDPELVAELAQATGLAPEALTTALLERNAVFLPVADRERAEELAEKLAARGIDAELEDAVVAPDKAQWLAVEAPKWVKRGFISPYSLPGLYQNYGLDAPATMTPAPARKQSDPGLLMRAILTIGAVLVGLGLILFVASNWQKIPDAAKIGGALALSLAALHAGYRLQHVGGPRPRLAACSYLIALFGIGGALALVAQVYHLVADTYLLPLVWGALCVPVALLLRFRPALYLASALWLWSYWLYADANGVLPWYFPLLLLGFLLPYSLAVGDRSLYWTHVALLMVALVSSVAGENFWLCTVWVLGLVALRMRDPRPIFDWLLLVAFFVWHVSFILRFEDLPNLFYLAPLAALFYRASSRRANWLLVATVASALIWLVTLLFQVTERFDLSEPTATGFLLWCLATGVLLFGLGGMWRDSVEWRTASVLLRVGGAALALIGAYAMSFRFYAKEDAFFESGLLLGTTALFGLTGVALGGLDSGGARVGRRLLLALVFLALALAVGLSPAFGLHVALFNLILFATALVLMTEGHRRDSLLWYNLGIGLFVVLIVTRYFDTFVDLLPRSVFFVLGGLFLIVWAVFADRQRRRRTADGGDDA